MSSVVGEERKALGVGIFDLKKQSLAFVMAIKYETLTAVATSFSVPGTTTILTLGASRTDQRVVAFSNSADPGQ
jgi:hypothetical protein